MFYIKKSLRMKGSLIEIKKLISTFVKIGVFRGKGCTKPFGSILHWVVRTGRYK